MLYDIMPNSILYYLIWYCIVLAYLLEFSDLFVCLCCKLGKRFCSFIAALGWTTGVRTEPVYIHISYLWSDTEHIFIYIIVCSTYCMYVSTLYQYVSLYKNLSRFTTVDLLKSWGVPPGSRVQGLVCLWPLLLGAVGTGGSERMSSEGQEAMHW